MRFLSTPAALLTGAIWLGLLLAAALTALSLSRPWLGLELSGAGDAAGAVVVRVAAGGPSAGVAPAGSRLTALAGAGGEVLPVGPEDLIEEPDGLDTYAAITAFSARQTALDAALRGGAVTLHLTGPAGAREVRVAPAPSRPPGDLPMVYWVQVGVGLAGFWIGFWVWSLRRQGLAEGFLFLAGIGLMVSAFAAAVYSTRELALPGGLFRALSAFNHAGALTFGVGMIGLFQCYPVRLLRGPALALPGVVLAAWFAANLAELFSGPPVGFHLPVVLAMLTILVFVGWQYRATKGDPAARGALRWFGLSVGAGAGAFVLTIIVPHMIGLRPALSQGHAFLFFLLIYAGLALGVRRYRLFELEGWAFPALFYMGGVALLLVLDAILIFALPVDRIPAFGASLLLVALVYLPLRDALARRFLRRAAPERENLFRSVSDVAFAPSPGVARARWEALLAELYSPLRILPGGGEGPALEDEGVALDLPGVAPVAALRLSHAGGGRRLFTRRDLALAREVCAMLEASVASRAAYETGVAEERARIARDMHDNIGVQLLGALHSPGPERKDTLIREALGDLRDIINDVGGPGMPLAAALADLRREVAEHLSAAGIALDWRAEAPGDAPPLAPRAAHALRALLREALGNILRHSGAGRVEIAFGHAAGRVTLALRDDGRGFDEAAVGHGRGLANMRARLAGFGGEVTVAARPGRGTEIRATLPLEGEA